MTRILQAVIAVGFTIAMFGLVIQADDTPRAINAAAGMLACLLLLFQLVRYWPETPTLVHALGILLIASVMLGAAATSVNAMRDAPANPILWVVLAHRLACVVVALAWSHLATAPYRRLLHERTPHAPSVPAPRLAARQSRG